MLDLQKILSLLFFLLGTILGGYGLATWDSEIYYKSFGWNINFYWGLFLLFAGFCFFLARPKEKAP